MWIFRRLSVGELISLRDHDNICDVGSHFLGCDRSTLVSVWQSAAPSGLLIFTFRHITTNGTYSYELSDQAMTGSVADLGAKCSLHLIPGLGMSACDR